MAATLNNRTLQHYASCFSLRSSMQPARSLQEEETYIDAGLIPRALNIRRPYLHENVTSPTRGYMKSIGPSDERQGMTRNGQLQMISSDVDGGYPHHHQRRPASYLPSPAQQALQRVFTPRRSTSIQSSRTRLTSLGSEIINTVRKHKPIRKALAASSQHNLPPNPLQAPSGKMSRPDSQFEGDRHSRSISISSDHSSLAGPSLDPLSAVVPYAYTERARISSAECLTFGGMATATLSLHSYTTVSTLSKPNNSNTSNTSNNSNNSPEVTVWVFAQVRASKFYEGLGGNNNPESNIPLPDDRENWSHGQINSLSMEITLPKGFDVVCVLGHSQQRQVKLGEPWSVVFKVRLHKKVSVTKFLQRAESIQPGTMQATDRLTAARIAHNSQTNPAYDRGMGPVEELLTPGQEVSVAVQYSENRYPTNLSHQVSTSCPINAVTESQRRRQQRNSALATNADLAHDMIVGDVIIAVLRDSRCARMSKRAKGVVRDTGISPADALQLLKGFGEAAGTTLPQSMTEAMAGLCATYEQERNNEQEQAPARKLSKVSALARRAVSFPGRRHAAREGTESTENLLPPPAGPLGDITNLVVREEDDEISAI